MSDIFISYKREEQPMVKKLATALEREGWTVWWDMNLIGGDPFDKVIQREIKASRCLIVLWSKKSVESDYVLAEAAEALQQKKLLPIAIENVEYPFLFKRLHTPKLLNWNCSSDSEEFRRIVEHIAARIGKPTRKMPVSTPFSFSSQSLFLQKLKRAGQRVPPPLAAGLFRDTLIHRERFQEYSR